MSRRHPQTAAVRSGIASDAAFGAVAPPLHLSSNFRFEGLAAKPRYDYTRSGNPTRDEFGAALAELEGASGAVVTSSGMAALTVDGEPDMAALFAHISGQIPEYARPIFLRILRKMDVTGTFKVKKTDLVKDGFNPDQISDPLFVIDPERRTYVPITPDLYAAIENRERRF